MAQFPHHRRSIRLPGYDYTQNGAYFVTLVTGDRKELFGHISSGEMALSPAGQVVSDAWLWLAHQYLYIILEDFCVMPNHFHGLLMIDWDGRGQIKVKPLGGLISAFKTVSTKRINELVNTPGSVLWQRNYYEHIVRSPAEMEKISRYINSNPMQWDLDRYHAA